MSEEKKTPASKSDKAETGAPTSAPMVLTSLETGPLTSVPTAVASLSSRVLERGKLGHAIAPPKPPAQPEGLYEVVHGSVLLGYEGEAEVRVGTGGKVHLTGEEAATLVAAKVVRILSAAA
jgi:hypothetical protein